MTCPQTHSRSGEPSRVGRSAESPVPPPEVTCPPGCLAQELCAMGATRNGTGLVVKLGGRGELLPDPRRDGERGRGGSDDVISGDRGI